MVSHISSNPIRTAVPRPTRMSDQCWSSGTAIAFFLPGARLPPLLGEVGKNPPDRFRGAGEMAATLREEGSGLPPPLGVGRGGQGAAAVPSADA